MHEKLYSEGVFVCVTQLSSRYFSSIYGKVLLSRQYYRSLLIHRVSNIEAITASLSSLSVDAQKRAEKDSKKKEAKAAAAEAREAEAKKEAMVYIKRVERNKRKYVTAISGLEAHGMDLKKVAKEFGKKCEWFSSSRYRWIDGCGGGFEKMGVS